MSTEDGVQSFQSTFGGNFEPIRDSASQEGLESTSGQQPDDQVSKEASKEPNENAGEEKISISEKEGTEQTLNREQNERLQKILMNLAEYARKVNENIIAVNEEGGKIIYPDVKLTLLRDMLKDQGLKTLLDLVPGGEEMSKTIEDMTQQDLRTGYDPDVMNAGVNSLQSFADTLNSL